jgi:hypothetical protein
MTVAYPARLDRNEPVTAVSAAASAAEDGIPDNSAHNGARPSDFATNRQQDTFIPGKIVKVRSADPSPARPVRGTEKLQAPGWVSPPSSIRERHLRAPGSVPAGAPLCAVLPDARSGALGD